MTDEQPFEDDELEPITTDVTAQVEEAARKILTRVVAELDIEDPVAERVLLDAVTDALIEGVHIGQVEVAAAVYKVTQDWEEKRADGQPGRKGPLMVIPHVHTPPDDSDDEAPDAPSV